MRKILALLLATLMLMVTHVFAEDLDITQMTIDELVGHEVPYLIDKSLLSQKQIELIDIIKTMSDEECNFLIAYSLGIRKGIEERKRNDRKRDQERRKEEGRRD